MTFVTVSISTDSLDPQTEQVLSRVFSLGMATFYHPDRRLEIPDCFWYNEGSMGTRRSLDKLEFRAHMSVHDTVDVKEGEAKSARFTRDRFGKRHEINGIKKKQKD